MSICGCDVCGRVVPICDDVIPPRSSSPHTCRGLIRVISDTCVGVQRLLISKPAAAAAHRDAGVQNSTARPHAPPTPTRSCRGDGAALTENTQVWHHNLKFFDHFFKSRCCRCIFRRILLVLCCAVLCLYERNRGQQTAQQQHLGSL